MYICLFVLLLIYLFIGMFLNYFLRKIMVMENKCEKECMSFSIDLLTQNKNLLQSKKNI